jgi:porphyrinogen peroxidase
VPPGLAGAGGSHVLAMRWVHDLTAFHRLSVGEQERVIGRTKLDSVELSETAKPRTAHIARVEVEREGRELELFRRSVPFGNVAERGLYFVAFSAERARYDVLLARMFGTAGDGIHDRLTEFPDPPPAPTTSHRRWTLSTPRPVSATSSSRVTSWPHPRCSLVS